MIFTPQLLPLSPNVGRSGNNSLIFSLILWNALIFLGGFGSGTNGQVVKPHSDPLKKTLKEKSDEAVQSRVILSYLITNTTSLLLNKS